MPQDRPETPEADEDENVGGALPPDGKPALSYGTAMAAYAVLGILCLATLHGDALYLCLLIIGAIAFKTWLARAKSRLE